MEFHRGDIVEWQGAKGIVIEVTDHINLSMLVDFGKIYVDSDIEFREYFHSNGKYHSWHKEPSLKLIERPKKMVKKLVTKWCNIYGGMAVANYDTMVVANYDTKEAADSNATHGRVACIEKTFEYEIEDEQ